MAAVAAAVRVVLAGLVAMLVLAGVRVLARIVGRRRARGFGLTERDSSENAQ